MKRVETENEKREKEKMGLKKTNKKKTEEIF